MRRARGSRTIGPGGIVWTFKAATERTSGSPRAHREASRPAPWRAGGVYTGLGDSDRAIDWVENACKERSDWLVWIKR